MATPPVKRRLMSSLDVKDVGYILCHLGLDKHVNQFRRFGIDGVVLAALKTEKDLEGELGLTSHVQRLNLISHIKDWTDKKGVPEELLVPKVAERARALSELNVEETCRLLEAIELPGVKEKAEAFKLDGHMLSVITEADLTKELKVESRLQRSKLLKRVVEYNTYGVPSSVFSDGERPTIDDGDWRPTDVSLVRESEDMKMSHK